MPPPQTTAAAARVQPSSTAPMPPPNTNPMANPAAGLVPTAPIQAMNQTVVTQAQPQTQPQAATLPQFATSNNNSNGNSTETNPNQPNLLLTPPPLLPPTAQHALPPRTTSAPRFSHRRRGAEPGLSSEGGARARYPPSHAQTPSGGAIPLQAGPNPNGNPNLAQHLNGTASLPLHNNNNNSNSGNHTAPSTAPVATGPGHSQQGHGRRQGKPIFEWFKGKLGARRSSDADHTREAAAAISATSGGKKIINGKLQPLPVVVQSLGYRTQPSPPLQSPSPPLPSPSIAAVQRAQLSPSDIFGQTRRDSSDSNALNRTESMSMRSYSMSFTNVPSERRRELNNPYPSLPIRFVRRSYPASTIDTESRPASMSYMSRSRTPSLVSLSSVAHRRPQISIGGDDDDSTRESLRYSGAYADEDASVRPIPPSPTRSMSINSAGMGSEALVRTDSIPRRVPGSSPPPPDRRDTFSSMTGTMSITSDEPGGRSRQNSLASTKPTTVMSFDSSAPAVAHIAVASPSISSSSPPVGAARSISSPPSGSGGATSSTVQASSPVSPTFLPPSVLPPDDVRVPRHTRYHPRNNPHPTSPPGPDASTVTLASSTFALNTERAPRPSSLRSPTSPWQANSHGTSPTVAFADAPGGGGAGSMYDGLSTHALYDGLSTHALSLNARSRGYGRADDDASMRAIRRRGSWESAESRWSWRPGNEAASMFAALGRSADAATDEGGAATVGPIGTVGTGTNRSSTHTRESFRTAYSAWTQSAPETESGELSTLTSESALVPHRPVSVRV